MKRYRIDYRYEGNHDSFFEEDDDGNILLFEELAKERNNYSDYTEGVAFGGVVFLKDGREMLIEEVLETLNSIKYLNADFDDCNTERARWREAAERQAEEDLCA